MTDQPRDLADDDLPQFLRDMAYFSTSLTTESENCIKRAADLLVSQSRELEELRRPVWQSAAVEAIRKQYQTMLQVWGDDWSRMNNAASSGWDRTEKLLSALDAAQLEIETLRRCLLQSQNAAIELAYSHTCFICSGDGQIEGKQCDACGGIGEYLREGESFIECIKRNRADAELTLKLYAEEKLKNESLSRELEAVTGGARRTAELNVQVGQENQRLRDELDAIKRTREQEEQYDNMCYELQKAREELAALRRPVGQYESEEIVEIRRKDSAWSDESLDRAVIEGHGAMRDRRVLLRALDAAQREIQQLIANHEKREDEMEAEIARLSSPPQERKEIQGRRNGTLKCYLPVPEQMQADIDTLLQDLRRSENAHAILMAERDDARSRVAQLTGELDLYASSLQGANASVRAYQRRVERLEWALRGLRNWAMVTDRGRYIHSPPVDLIDPADELLGDHAPVVDVRELAAADGGQCNCSPSFCAQQHGGDSGMKCRLSCATGDGVAGE